LRQAELFRLDDEPALDRRHTALTVRAARRAPLGSPRWAG